MPGPISRWRRVARRERWLAAEACARIVVSRVAIAVLPFRRVATRLGRAGGADVVAPAPPDPQVVLPVRRALRRAEKVVPFASTCLAQAMAGQQMLERRGAGSTIHLGVDRSDEDMAAHAWLTCGDVVVCGGRERAAFTAVASFTRPG